MMSTLCLSDSVTLYIRPGVAHHYALHGDRTACPPHVAHMLHEQHMQCGIMSATASGHGTSG